MDGIRSVSAFAAYKKTKQKNNNKVLQKKKKDSKRKDNRKKLQAKVKLAVSDLKSTRANVNGDEAIISSETKKTNIVKAIKRTKSVQKNLNGDGLRISSETKKRNDAKTSSLSCQVKEHVPVRSKKRKEKVKKQSNSIKSRTEDDDEEPPQLVEAMFTDSEDETENLEEIEAEINNSTLEATKLFQWLLHPSDTNHFFVSHWEKKPYHLQRNHPGYFKHIMSSEMLDEMLRENSLFYTRNVDVVSYEGGKRETHNPEGRAVPSAVWDYYQNGCSVRILNPQSYSPKLHLLLATLQEYFGAMVGANIYLTPPGSQGFAPHWDDIEAFVLQVEGRKHWKLYKSSNPNHELARYSSHNLSRSELGEQTHSLTLEEGCVLYFPRGTIHEAYTDPDSHSLHVTVSVYQNTSYADLLEKVLPLAIKRMSEVDVEYRKGLPMDYLTYAGVGVSSDPDAKHQLELTVKNLVVKMVNHISIDEGVDQLGRKFMYDSLPPVLTSAEKSLSVREDGEYLSNGRIYNAVEFTPSTKIRLLRYYCMRLVIEDATPRIYYNTENSKTYHEEEEQFLELEMTVVPVICHIINSFPKYVTIEELPHDDEVVKIQIVSDLWERGILVTKKRLCCIDEAEDE